MNTHSRFNIVNAIRNALVFCHGEWRYIFALALPPMAAEMLLVILLRHFLPDATMIQMALWELPVTALTGWFMCLLARRIVLGERIDRMTPQETANPQRTSEVRAGVMIWLLFSMACSLMVIYVVYWAQMADALQRGETVSSRLYSIVSVGGMFVFGVAIWGARMAVAHLVASVGYSVRKYLYRVNGAMISFRFIGMGLLLALPASVILQMALSIRVSAGDSLFVNISFSLFAIVFTMAFTAVLCAAGVFALKEMLASPNQRLKAV